MSGCAAVGVSALSHLSMCFPGGSGVSHEQRPVGACTFSGRQNGQQVVQHGAEQVRSSQALTDMPTNLTLEMINSRDKQQDMGTSEVQQLSLSHSPLSKNVFRMCGGHYQLWKQGEIRPLASCLDTSCVSLHECDRVVVRALSSVCQSKVENSLKQQRWIISSIHTWTDSNLVLKHYCDRRWSGRVKFWNDDILYPKGQSSTSCDAFMLHKYAFLVIFFTRERRSTPSWLVMCQLYWLNMWTRDLEMTVAASSVLFRCRVWLKTFSTASLLPKY